MSDFTSFTTCRRNLNSSFSMFFQKCFQLLSKFNIPNSPLKAFFPKVFDFIVNSESSVWGVHELCFALFDGSMTLTKTKLRIVWETVENQRPRTFPMFAFLSISLDVETLGIFLLLFWNFLKIYPSRRSRCRCLLRGGVSQIRYCLQIMCKLSWVGYVALLIAVDIRNTYRQSQ